VFFPFFWKRSLDALFWDVVTHRLHGRPGKVRPRFRGLRGRSDRGLAFRSSGDEVSAVFQDAGRGEAVSRPPRPSRVRHHLRTQRRGTARLVRGNRGGCDVAARYHGRYSHEAQRIAPTHRADAACHASEGCVHHLPRALESDDTRAKDCCFRFSSDVAFEECHSVAVYAQY
jgi:hypothetical protein